MIILMFLFVVGFILGFITTFIKNKWVTLACILIILPLVFCGGILTPVIVLCSYLFGYGVGTSNPFHRIV
jgi:hypothetical protein